MYHNVNAIEHDVEELVCLDDFESLVHQGGTVNRDLCAHVPCWMRECIRNGDVLQLVACTAAERTAARGQDDAPHLGRTSAAQALVNRGMFRVDRHDLTATGGTRLRDDRTRGDET